VADSKQTSLSIVIRTVDDATARIKAINAQLDAINKPTKDLKKAFSELAEKSGLDKVASGVKGVGRAVGDLLSKAARIGGVIAGGAALAVHELFGLVQQFDDLGDEAERLGVSVDFLAQMKYAAAKAGVPVDALDEGLKTFSQNIGQATTHTGRMYKFLTLVSPALRDQVVKAKSSAEAFDLVANAIAKLPDPMRRAALAQKVFGDSDLGALLAKGGKGVKALRDRYLELAGSQQEAADKAGAVDDSLHDLHATEDGLKAAIVTGFGPALKQLVDELAAWFKENRGRVAEWAKDFGEKLPAAVHRVADAVQSAIATVRGLVADFGGLKNVAIGAVAILAGPLIKAVVELGIALATAGLRAVALAKGIGSIPATTAGGAAAGAAGSTLPRAAAVGGGSSVLGSVVLPFAAGIAISHYGEKYIGHEGLASKIARIQAEHGDTSASDYIDRNYDAGPSPLELVQRGLDSYRDANNSRGSLGSSFGGGAGGGLVGPVKIQGDNKIKVEFVGAPRGTRVTADPKNTDDVDLSIGYLLAGGA